MKLALLGVIIAFLSTGALTATSYDTSTIDRTSGSNIVQDSDENAIVNQDPAITIEEDSSNEEFLTVQNGMDEDIDIDITLADDAQTEVSFVQTTTVDTNADNSKASITLESDQTVSLEVNTGEDAADSISSADYSMVVDSDQGFSAEFEQRDGPEVTN